jgi:hypothetical protein
MKFEQVQNLSRPDEIPKGSRMENKKKPRKIKKMEIWVRDTRSGMQQGEESTETPVQVSVQTTVMPIFKLFISAIV